MDLKPTANSQNPQQNNQNADLSSIGFNVNDVSVPKESPRQSQIGTAEKTSVSTGRSPVTKGSLAGIYDSIGLGASRKVIDHGFLKMLDYLVILISLGVIAALIFLVIIPQYNTYNTYKFDIVEARQEFEKVNAHYEYLSGLKDFEDQMTRNVGLSKQAITVEEEVPQFLNQLSVVAEEALVDLKKNDFSGTSKSEDLITKADGSTNTDLSVKPGTINVRSSITAPYENLEQFLARLEKARRISVFSDIRMMESDKKVATSVSPDNTEADDVSVAVKEYDLELSITAYHLKDPDISSLSVEQLVAKKWLPDVMKKLEEMVFYDLVDVESLDFGRVDPFYELDTNIEGTIE